jgi:ribosome-associated toxin RatA of RatAB toxin-antitoxin module
MKSISATKRVRAPGDAVFEHLLLVTEYHRWLVGCTASKLETGEEGQLDSQYRISVGVGSFSDSVSLVLRTIDREQRVVRLVKPQPTNPIALQISVDGATEPCQVTVELQQEWSGKVLGVPVQGRLFRMMLAGLLDQSAPRLAKAVRERAAQASDQAD